MTLLGSTHIVATNILVIHDRARGGWRLVVIVIAVFILTEGFELHQWKVEARDYRIIKLKPGLLVGLKPLLSILASWISLPIDVYVGDVVTSISDAHVDDDADKFEIELCGGHFLAISNEVLQILVLFFTPDAINVGFFSVHRLLLRGSSFFVIELSILVLVSSIYTVYMCRVTWSLLVLLHVGEHFVEHELADIDLIRELKPVI